MSLLYGTQISPHWVLHHCLKFMQMWRILVPTGTNNLEISHQRANKREPESHVLTSKRGKAFLSQKLIIATRPPATGVAAIIMLLRNAGPLSILLNYTWSPWVVHRTLKSQKHTSFLKCWRLKLWNPSLKERDQATPRLRQLTKALWTSTTCSWISPPMTSLETSNRLHTFIFKFAEVFL